VGAEAQKGIVQRNEQKTLVSIYPAHLRLWFIEADLQLFALRVVDDASRFDHPYVTTGLLRSLKFVQTSVTGSNPNVPNALVCIWSVVMRAKALSIEHKKATGC
jgi:hypothetical protein